MSYNVQYAMSLSIAEHGGLWKIQFVHPLDAMIKVSTWIAPTIDDERIGTTVDGLNVSSPGTHMTEVLAWLSDLISNYPYYWPYEGNPIDKYGYDFTVNMSISSGNTVSKVEMTDIAYSIVKNNLSIQPQAPGNQEVDQSVYYLQGGGALIKYTITLDKAQPVSEVTITPFSEFDLEVESIMYEEDIETYHVRKELIPQTITYTDEKPYSTPTNPQASTKMMVFKFPAIIAKRFTFILRQKNYKKDTYLIREKDISEKDLWDKISQREAEVTLDVTDGLDTVETNKIDVWTGWDIYQEQLQKYYNALKKWQDDMQIYRQKLAERQAAIDLQNQYNTEYGQAMDQYNAEKAAAVAKYNQQVADYRNRVAAYNSAKDTYDRNLALYNKYLRDLKDWQTKWG